MRFTVKKTLVYVLGLALLGVTVTLMQQTNLGMSAWDAFYRNMYDGIPLDYRYLNPIVALVIAPLGFLIQKKQLTVWVLFPIVISFFIGAVIDGLLLVVPNVSAMHWSLNVAYLLASIPICAIGLNLCIHCQYPLPALDELCYGIGVLFKTTYGKGKLIGEILAIGLAVITGLIFDFWNVYFNIGITTIVFGVAIGPAIDLFKKPVKRVMEALSL